MILFINKFFENKNIYRLFFVGLILINVFVFISVILKPIVCRNGEITHFNFLWCMSFDKSDPFVLHGGIHKEDFKKIFLSNELEDGTMRFRQFSYLVDMGLFKFWQSLGITTFRTTLIFLHLLNVFLFFFCLKKFPLSKNTALLCSCLFLNSAPALSSLLFPFRLTKMLLISLFLIAWIVWHAFKTPSRTSKHDVIFCVLLLLMLFTDEMAPIFILILYIYFYFKKRLSPLRISAHLITIFICFVLLASLIISIQHGIGQRTDNIALSQLKGLQKYLGNPKCLVDIMRAFIFYFLRRHFGYWDHSFWGTMSFISFIGLLFIACLNIASKNKLWVFISFIFLIFIKAAAFPHANGVHGYIMGNNTFFPTVLFFNYYYTYPDSVLIIIALGALINSAVLRDKSNFILILLMVTIINISNAVHADEGIRDAINQHKYYQTGYRNIPNIASLDKLKPLAALKPIYLSFPSGSQPVFKRFLSSECEGWRMDPLAQKQNLLLDFIDYGSFVPVQYFKLIEKGEFIISLQNVPSIRKFKGDNEILSASFFYDALTKKCFDLNKIAGPGSLKETSLFVSNGAPIDRSADFTHYQDLSKIIFFVKGGSGIDLILDGKDNKKSKAVKFLQNYGYSYQEFEVSLKDIITGAINKVYLTVTPATKGEHIALWGPFYE